MSRKSQLTKAHAKKQTLSGPNGEHVSHQEFSVRSGPFPESEELAAYDALYPGSAGKIIEMAIEEQKHTHEIELKQARIIEIQQATDNKFNARGQFMAFAIIAAVIALAAYMVTKEAYASAATMVGGVLAAYVGAFIYSQRNKA